MKKIYFLCFFIFKAFAFESNLPDTIAFKSSLEFNNQQSTNVIFDIADGYDIYADKINIITSPNSGTKIGKIIYPDPISMTNDVVGNYKVYQSIVYIPIPITEVGNGKLSLQVTFQGCKGLSYCYPGMKRILTANLNKIKHSQTTNIAPISTVSSQGQNTASFVSNLFSGK